MNDLSLLDELVAEAMLDDGIRSAQVARVTGLDEAAVETLRSLPDGAKPSGGRPWTAEDEAFLRDNVGRLSTVEIAAALGRTPAAVKIRRYRHLNLGAPTRHPDYLTLQQVADMFSIDAHIAALWVERGMLRAENAPVDGCAIRRVAVYDIKRFAVKPEHWMCFKAERIADPHLRALVRRAQVRWGDEWLTPGQTAQMHALKGSAAVNDAILAGRLPAVRWGNWWIRRSDAVTASFWVRKKGSVRGRWSEAADAFLVLARAVGVFETILTKMVKGTKERARLRLRQLHTAGQVPCRIAGYGLAVAYRPSDGALLADWKTDAHRRRFPGIAGAMARFAAGEILDAGALAYVRGVYAAWARWFGRQDLATCFIHGGHRSQENLRRLVEQMKAAGIDPFELFDV